jgi:HAD superfamily phosphatase (TIGR01681 family)
MSSEETDAPADRTLFDEAWYIDNNPGIAKAVRDGAFRSGWEHYVRHGRAEGRHAASWTTLTGAKGNGPKHHRGSNAVASYSEHNWTGFLTPTDLAVTPTKLTRVAVIDTPLMRDLRFHQRNLSDCRVDLMPVDAVAGGPGTAPVPPGFYDFIVIHIPLGDILSHDFLWHIPLPDITAHDAELQRTCIALESRLQVAMQWNRRYGLLTFVANYFQPQRNSLGRLFPRYDIRNPEYFVERVNEHLERIVRQATNAYVLDLDRLSASIGRRFTQDDAVFAMAQNGLWPFDVANSDRIEPMAALFDHYDMQWQFVFPDMVWTELLAMYRAVRATDLVKLVVVDLDDTLWNGVSRARTDGAAPTVQGWPMGLAEALLYLRKRGISLAIVCQDEASQVQDAWPKIFRGHLRLEDFAAVCINHAPKPDNMRTLLESMNLPPGQVVFIDDDPGQREAMQQAFPDMRVLGRHPYYLRRILLWSAETEVIPVSDDRRPLIAMIQTILVGVKRRSELPWQALTGEVWRRIESASPGAAREILGLLWEQAMDNAISAVQADAIRRLCMVIAIADRGADRLGVVPGWDA